MVIPAGILAGLPVVPVVLAGVIGNLTTVGLAAWLGERVCTWWVDRRRPTDHLRSRVGTVE